MAYSNTGFFRVNKVNDKRIKQGFRYAYQMKNELVKVDVRKTNIMDLKNEILKRELLWGITDMEKAIETANENGVLIAELEGRYGLQMNRHDGFEPDSLVQNELELNEQLEMDSNLQIVIRNLTDEQKTELKEALEEHTEYGAIKLPSTALLEVKPMRILGQQKRNHELDIVKIFKITDNKATDLVAETERVFKEINFKFPTHCYDNSLKGNGELIPYPHTTESILEIASDEDLIGSSRPFNKVLNSEIIINVYCLLCDIPSPTWSMQRRNPFA